MCLFFSLFFQPILVRVSQLEFQNTLCFYYFCTPLFLELVLVNCLQLQILESKSTKNKCESFYLIISATEMICDSFRVGVFAVCKLIFVMNHGLKSLEIPGMRYRLSSVASREICIKLFFLNLVEIIVDLCEIPKGWGGHCPCLITIPGVFASTLRAFLVSSCLIG